MAQPGSLSAEMEAMSHVMSLVESFRAFDSDNDGSITAAELGGIMGSLGYNPSEQEVRAMMQRGDTNRDGLLSIEEFLDMNTNELEVGSIATSLRRVFEALDFEDDDVVTGEELHEAMNDIGLQLSLDDCQDIIASVDGNGNGTVSFEDFKLVVNALL
ncbi:probable calcium-binding protein CML29 [Cornus florida]|uniref:probable calcium-binding protein CML29 n=1 Tax=Cornus florida TaxID=4283 RepID=UPI00289641D4|nr:probable calcium-binding protein CML29 [Cornus florida]